MKESEQRRSDDDGTTDSSSNGVNRRRVLQGIGAAGVGGALTGQVSAQSAQAGLWNHAAASNATMQHDGEEIPTSCQFFSFIEAGLSTAELIYEAGEFEYDAVEPFGGVGNLGDVDEVLQALDDTGLQLSSTHIDTAEVEEDVEGVAEVYQQFGEIALIEPYGDDEIWTSEESVVEFAERCNTLADELADYDLEFGYHNHDQEFVQIDDGDEIAYDIFAQEVQDNVHLQIDAGWILSGGEDPIHYIVEYADKVSSIHMKNMTYDGEIVEIDEGDVGMRGVATAARNAADVDYLTYEYDQAPNPIESMGIGADWMNRLNHPWSPGGVCTILNADTHPAKIHEPNQELVDQEEEEEGDDGGDEEETGDEEEGEDDASADVIEPGTRIEFSGDTGGWIGIAPGEIEGAENPTLTLGEGETYEIGWTETDGAAHNIEIRDDSGAVVGDLSTSLTSDPGDDQWLEFEASTETVEYVCEPHAGTMAGDIVVE